MPGRWDEVRLPTARELAATLVLSLPLDEASVKVRSGPPSEEEEPDAVDPAVWAGVLPVWLVAGDPVAAPDTPPTLPVPPSLMAARRRIAEGAAPGTAPGTFGCAQQRS
jgi:uncharacterized protein